MRIIRTLAFLLIAALVYFKLLEVGHTPFEAGLGGMILSDIILAVIEIFADSRKLHTLI